MPTWKKLVVSGSNISQLVNDVNYVINTQDNASLSGSFSGSFYGDGSNITNVQASTIEYANILNKPTLVSGSSQVTISDTTGYTAFSSSIDAHLDANISAVNTSISNLSASAATANTNLYSDVTSDISSLSSSVDAHLDANISAVNTSISNLSSSAHSQRVAIESDLYTEISTVSASFATSQATQDGRLNSLESFTASLDATYTTDAELNAATASLKTYADSAVDTLSGSAATANSNLSSDLTSAYQSADSALSGSAHSQRVALISALSSSVDAHLDANISAVNTSISNLSSSAATANTNLSASAAQANVNLSSDLTSAYQSADSTLSGSAHSQRVALISALSGSAHTANANLASDLSIDIASLSGSAHSQRVALYNQLDTDLDNVSASFATTIANQGTDVTNLILSQSDFDSAISLDGTNVTVIGNLNVSGTTTYVNSTQIELGDNILELNGTGSNFAGLKVNDNNGPASGSLLWDGINNQWIAGGEGSESKILLATGDNVVSGSSQITISDTTGYTAFSQSIDTHLDANISAVNTSITNLSSSVDAHLDANVSALNTSISNLSGSAHTQREALINALSSSVDSHLDANISAVNSSISSLSSSAHSQRLAIESGLDTDITSLSSSLATTISGLSQTLSISGSSGDVDLDLKTQDLTIAGDGGGISTSISGNTISLVSNGVVSSSAQTVANLVGEDIVANSFSGNGAGLTGITVDQAATVSSTFTNVTSTTVSHNFDSRNVNIVVYDSDYKQIIPASVTLTTTNLATIEFCEATTGTVVVAKGGHIVSGSVAASSIDGLNDAINEYLDIDGVVSSSVQIDIEQTTNFSSFSASIDTRLGGGVSELSSSAAQANTDLSSSFATTISGLSQTLSISGSTGDTDVDLKTEDLTFAGDGGGISTSITGNTVSLVSNGVVSGSSQVVLSSTTGYTAFSSSIDAHLDANISALSASAHTANINLSSSVDAHLDANIAAVNTSISNVSSSFASTINNLSSTLAISGSTGNDTVNLVNDSLTISGTAGEIETTVTNNQVQIGIVTNPTLTGNVTVTGDLTIQGDTIQAQVTNLNVEDRFILLNSGSNSGDSGIIFGGSDGTANEGSGIFWDSPSNVFGYSSGIGSTDVTATHEAKLGYIQQHATDAPSTAPSFQGVGSIHIKEDTGCIYIYA